jgi:hypothetical protein
MMMEECGGMGTRVLGWEVGGGVGLLFRVGIVAEFLKLEEVTF